MLAVSLSPVVDSLGRTVLLGAEIGRGGEGTVLAVADRPGLVAKLYHKPLGTEHVAKLRAMIALKTERLLKIAAWPVDTVHQQVGGPALGLLMPRVVGYKPIHQLYSPKARRGEFPRAGWPFLIHAAANLARAFAVVHEHGHVVGDVNHGNVVVSGQAMVLLIDCDSFQIASAGQRFLCDVGVSTHQPPELQAQSTFRGVVRTPNHDNFGLAVLIFQVLMMGRHPHAGRFLGTGDLPIERAIVEHRFAYGSNAAARQMQPPPGSLPLEVLSGPVASAFERAFSPDGMRERGRPTGREWIAALEQLAERLKRCHRKSGHSYLETLRACPWCEVETKAGAVFFAGSVVDPPASARGIDLAAVWAEIEAVLPPGGTTPLPRPESVKREPSAEARRAGQFRRLRQSLAAAAVGAGGAAWILGVPVSGPVALMDLAPAALAAGALYRGSPNARQTGEREAERARKRWLALSARWKSEAGDQAFRAKRRELDRAREEYLGLPTRRQRQLHQLESDLRFRQLQRFLDRYAIDGAQLPGIGPGREATLRSFGIETAADVTAEAIAAIPGFGPTRSAKLLEWRDRLAQQFVFDPSAPSDPRDVEALEADLRAAKLRLEQTLRGGAATLRQLAQRTHARRQALRSEIDQALAELAQAEADLTVL